MKENLIVKAFDGLAKFFYALLPAVLPYSTPLPIAMITASSAETFFNMTPWVAGVFVFSLEGLGVWSTTALIDRVVEWVRSRNPKVAWTVVILFAVVTAYIAILILLNVVLKGDKSPAYKAAVTLICFLPFIAGVLNGFHKVGLKDQDMVLYNSEEQRKLRAETRDFQLKKLSITSQARNTQTSRGTSTSPRSTSKPQNLGDEVRKKMDEAYSRGRILSAPDLISMGFDKSTAWRHRNTWLEEHNMKEK